MLVTIIGSVAALVGVLETVTGWGRQLVRAVRGRTSKRGADHRAIHGGPWPIHLPPDSSTDQVRITVFCAPSQSLQDPVFDIPKAVRFAQLEMHLAGEPKYTGLNEGVRVEGPDHDGFSDYAWVCANGRLDLSVSIPVSHDGHDRRQLDVIDLLTPITVLASAVRSTAYASVYGLPTRRKARRFDWLIGVSMYSRFDMSHRSSWDDLIFPGRVPVRLVADRQAFCPPGGYAAGELQDLDPSRPTNELLQTFLRSFLIENGYHEFDGAIDDAVSQFS